MRRHDGRGPAWYHEPSHFTFNECMTVFAVMVTDVIILDVFNNLGTLPCRPLSQLVFELGGTHLS